MSDDDDSTEIDVQPAPITATLHGHHIAWNYSTRFWLSLIGPVPWCLWQVLIGFCYGHKDTCWPSISLLADIAAGGDRNRITGRWETQAGERKRRPGAIETLEAQGLITVHSRPPDQRYTFHVLKEPPLLTPAQLATLPRRLQLMHTELLNRCAIDEATYLAAAQASTTLATPETHYTDTRLLEETWRRVLADVRSTITTGNFDIYLSRTKAHDFDPTSATLYVHAPDPLTTMVLTTRLKPLLLRSAATMTINGVSITDLTFSPRGNYA